MLLPLRRKIEAYFGAGLLTVLPIFVTVVVVRFVFSLFEYIGSPLKRIVGSDILVSLAGIIIAFCVIVLAGFLGTNIVGKRLIRWSEHLLSRVPLVNTLYSGAKQFFHLLFMKNRKTFSQVVLVPYPRKGVYSIGFVTSERNPQASSVIKEEVYNVYVPTALNIASGFLVMVPKDELIPIDISVEEGFKMVISGGVITPQLKEESHPELKN